MELDLAGKLRNTHLPTSKPLLPLFDTVVNSIHAIEDRKRSDGNVTARILRDRSQALLKEAEHTHYPVSGFIVEDNGTGFDDANFRSFNTSDSTWKKERGGKGIGRFLWLKAFRQVRVESWFREDGGLRHRTFHFAEPAGVSDSRLETADDRDTGSIVHLEGMIPRFSDTCPRSKDVIATRITDHCAAFFIRSDCPKIDLVDDDATGQSLNDWFQQQGYVEGKAKPFTVAGQSFEITHLHVRDAQAKHRIYLCANDREVTSEPINIPDLPRRLMDDSGSTFVLASRVGGVVLDQNTNQERTGFTLPQDQGDKDLYSPAITLDQIREAALTEVRTHVAPQLEAAAQRKIQQIETYIETSAPEYRPLLKHNREQLTAIQPDLPPERLERELHAAKYLVEAETRQEANTLLSEQFSPEDYDKKLEALLGRLNDFGKSELVKYVGHRRIVLELFEKALGLRPETGKYSLEGHVHRIIFPLRTTSDDVDFSQQNLWMIDERLAYHRYLASDTPLADGPGLEGRDRPDLLIFNRPFAFGEDGSTAAIVIIEFKRPLRNDYTDDENPIEQAYDYVRKIQGSKAKDRSGRLIPITPSTPFYAYVLADPTDSLVRQAENSSFIRTPDGQGFYGYNSALRTYVELVSYTKMLDDAKKRNRAFFERLGIPGP